MNPKTRQKLIYGLFVCAIIFGIYHLKGSVKKLDPSPEDQTQEMTAPPKAMPTSPIDIKKYSSLEWGRDPFYRPITKKTSSVVGTTYEPTSQEWILGGILFDEKSPTAIINKNIVRPGDSIDGAYVVKIDRKSVTLKTKNSNFSITMVKGGI